MRLDTIDMRILKSLPRKQDELGDIVPISKGRISRRIKKLEAMLLVKKNRQGLFIDLELTQLGRQTVATSSISHPNRDTSNSKSTPTILVKRVHSLGQKYAFKDALTAYDVPSLLINAGFEGFETVMPNNRAFCIIRKRLQGGVLFTIEVHNTCVLTYLSDLYTTEDTLDATIKQQAKLLSDIHVKSLEEQMRKVSSVRLVREHGELLSEVVQQHFALEHHPMAEALPKGEQFHVYDLKDGNLRLDIDMSKGFRELETKHKASAGMDADKLFEQLSPIRKNSQQAQDEQWNGLLDGSIDLRDLPIVKEIAIQNTLSIKEEKAWFRHHDEQIVELTKLIQEVREERAHKGFIRKFLDKIF